MTILYQLLIHSVQTNIQHSDKAPCAFLCDKLKEPLCRQRNHLKKRFFTSNLMKNAVKIKTETVQSQNFNIWLTVFGVQVLNTVNYIISRLISLSKIYRNTYRNLRS